MFNRKIYLSVTTLSPHQPPQDFVVIANRANKAVNLAGLILTDSKGADHADALVFPLEIGLLAGSGKITLCKDEVGVAPELGPP